VIVWGERMSRPRKFNFEKPVAVADDEDRVTLVAIRGGVRDGKAGRTVPAKKIRKLRRLSLADSSLRKAQIVLGLTAEQVLATLPQSRKRVFARHYIKRNQPAKSPIRRRRKK
jgi:hypothetical protein